MIPYFLMFLCVLYAKLGSTIQLQAKHCRIKACVVVAKSQYENCLKRSARLLESSIGSIFKEEFHHQPQAVRKTSRAYVS